MKSESNKRPATAEIEMLTNGMADVILRENVTEQNNNGEIFYTYDEYRLTVPYRKNLSKNVNNRLNEWMTSAKNAEYSKLAAEIRAKRDKLLAESDKWMVFDRLGLEIPDSIDISEWIGFFRSLGNVLVGEWAKYRQALRDITKQPGFPFDVTFPEKPDEKGEKQ